VPDAVAEGSEGGAAGKSEKPPRPAGREVTEIELEVSRQRSLSRTIFGIIVGGLLIWKLGTVGVWGGVVLVAMGVYHAWLLAQTLLYPPGTIVVSEREVSLPRGLCVPRPVTVKPEQITAVYFLRRSVPWNHASPVLIVEIGPKAMAFPRDWFASEADQRHVIHHLLALLPKLDAKADVKAEAKSDVKADVKSDAKADANADAVKSDAAN